MTGIQIVLVIAAILTLVVVSFWCGASWASSSFRLAEKRAADAVSNYKAIVAQAIHASEVERQALADK